MDRVSREKVSKSRLLYQNPYALAEYLYPDEYNEMECNKSNMPIAQISEERKRLQDPYAFLDENGNYSGVILNKNESSELVNIMPKSRRYLNSQIERQATKLLKNLWKNRQQICGKTSPDPIEVINPAKAFELLGFNFSYTEELGEYYSNNGEVQVAGVINGDLKMVQVSKRFPISVQNFTAAHELGHAVLHEIRGSVHRDKALDGESNSRDPMEREADKFATFFLMPAKLVRARFFEIFGTESFLLTEDTAFALTCRQLAEVKKKHQSRRELCRLLAGAKSYSGQNFYSLADQFNVSVAAMAIRLEELTLIKALK